MDSMTELRVQVPTTRVGEFYELIGRWFRDGSMTSPPANVASPATQRAYEPEILGRGEAWKRGDERERLQDAAALYGALSPTSRRVLDYWLDHGGQRVKADDIARDLGLDSPRTISGALSSFARQGKKGGRRGLPFFWEPSYDGTYYWMDSEVADLFGRARNEGLS